MIIPNGFGQLNMVFRGVAVPNGAQCTIGFKKNPGWTAADLGAAIHGWWSVDAEPASALCSYQCTLDHLLIKEGPTNTGLATDYVINEPGTADSDSLPPQAAMLVRKSTALGGRRQRGRLYFPGGGEGATNGGGVLLAGFVTVAQARFEDLFSNMSGAASPPYLLHGHADDAPTAITALTVVNKLQTQRDRARI